MIFFPTVVLKVILLITVFHNALPSNFNLTLAENSCNSEACQLPDCRCAGTDIPGGLDRNNTPQIVTISFDDGLRVIDHEMFYSKFLKDRLNPNGCPITLTFYISHYYSTDYSLVENLHREGHEMAVHTVTHRTPSTYWSEDASKEEWSAEIEDMKDLLTEWGNVPSEDITGFRCPFLASSEREIAALHDLKFTYEASMLSKEMYWPFTLDYKSPLCETPSTCPDYSYPGLWIVPDILFDQTSGIKCGVLDTCTHPFITDESIWFNFFVNNFNRHYEGNRAPFGIYAHAAWFFYPGRLEGLMAFLDWLQEKDDIYIVSVDKMLKWVRNPTPLSEIDGFTDWQCPAKSQPSCSYDAINKNTCIYPGQPERVLSTCVSDCPPLWPDLGNVLGANINSSQPTHESVSIGPSQTVNSQYTVRASVLSSSNTDGSGMLAIASVTTDSVTTSYSAVVQPTNSIGTESISSPASTNAHSTTESESVNSYKASAPITSNVPTVTLSSSNEEILSTSVGIRVPSPTSLADTCQTTQCQLPDCRCAGTDIPGGLDRNNTPQIVTISFDDGLRVIDHEMFYSKFLKDRLNPNGCPITLTFYISHYYSTDYSLVENLHREGHEMAVHTVTHRTPSTYWSEDASREEWSAEIEDMKDLLTEWGNVPSEDITGFRCPFLASSEREIAALHDLKFTYEASMLSEEMYWPFTLDYKSPLCETPSTCPDYSYPGLWIVPDILFDQTSGIKCGVLDTCTHPFITDESIWFNFFVNNFNRHYEGNRAPFGIYAHAAWFFYPGRLEGLMAFLDWLQEKDDIYIVSVDKMLKWVRNPTPLSEIDGFTDWQCPAKSQPSCSYDVTNKNTCIYPGQPERVLSTCVSDCPPLWPDLGNVLGADINSSQPTQDSVSIGPSQTVNSQYTVRASVLSSSNTDVSGMLAIASVTTDSVTTSYSAVVQPTNSIGTESVSSPASINAHSSTESESVNSYKASAPIISNVPTVTLSSSNEEILSTSVGIRVPSPTSLADTCQTTQCQLPDCRCAGTDIPGGLDRNNTPQIVTISFDDGLRVIDHEMFYSKFLKDRLNPNGCPITLTFYISHYYSTDYSLVENLHREGHEMAVHTVTHRTPSTYWSEDASKEEWSAEIEDMKDLLTEWGNVPSEDITGFRCPFLASSEREIAALHDLKFTYEASMLSKEMYWPFTLDYKSPLCETPSTCPDYSYPGLWIVPDILFDQTSGIKCGVLDTCTHPFITDESIWFNFFVNNFNRHYEGNRAPFGIYAHAAWFFYPGRLEGLMAFLDWLQEKDDIFIVSVDKMLKWVRNPTPLSEINGFTDWQCPAKSQPSCSYDVTNKNTCIYPGQPERVLSTCVSDCPPLWPDLGNVLGADINSSQPTHESVSIGPSQTVNSQYTVRASVLSSSNTDGSTVPVSTGLPSNIQYITTVEVSSSPVVQENSFSSSQVDISQFSQPISESTTSSMTVEVSSSPVVQVSSFSSSQVDTSQFNQPISESTTSSMIVEVSSTPVVQVSSFSSSQVDTSQFSQPIPESTTSSMTVEVSSTPVVQVSSFSNSQVDISQFSQPISESTTSSMIVEVSSSPVVQESSFSSSQVDISQFSQPISESTTSSMTVEVSSTPVVQVSSFSNSQVDTSQFSQPILESTTSSMIVEVSSTPVVQVSSFSMHSSQVDTSQFSQPILESTTSSMIVEVSSRPVVQVSSFSNSQVDTSQFSQPIPESITSSMTVEVSSSPVVQGSSFSMHSSQVDTSQFSQPILESTTSSMIVEVSSRPVVQVSSFSNSQVDTSQFSQPIPESITSSMTVEVSSSPVVQGSSFSMRSSQVDTSQFSQPISESITSSMIVEVSSRPVVQVSSFSNSQVDTSQFSQPIPESITSSMTVEVSSSPVVQVSSFSSSQVDTSQFSQPISESITSSMTIEVSSRPVVQVSSFSNSQVDTSQFSQPISESITSSMIVEVSSRPVVQVSSFSNSQVDTSQFSQPILESITSSMIVEVSSSPVVQVSSFSSSQVDTSQFSQPISESTTSSMIVEVSSRPVVQVSSFSSSQVDTSQFSQPISESTISSMTVEVSSSPIVQVSSFSSSQVDTSQFSQPISESTTSSMTVEVSSSPIVQVSSFSSSQVDTSQFSQPISESTTSSMTVEVSSSPIVQVSSFSSSQVDTSQFSQPISESTTSSMTVEVSSSPIVQVSSFSSSQVDTSQFSQPISESTTSSMTVEVSSSPIVQVSSFSSSQVDTSQFSQPISESITSSMTVEVSSSPVVQVSSFSSSQVDTSQFSQPISESITSSMIVEVSSRPVVQVSSFSNSQVDTSQFSQPISESITSSMIVEVFSSPVVQVSSFSSSQVDTSQFSQPISESTTSSMIVEVSSSPVVQVSSFSNSQVDISQFSQPISESITSSMIVEVSSTPVVQVSSFSNSQVDISQFSQPISESITSSMIVEVSSSPIVQVSSFSSSQVDTSQFSQPISESTTSSMIVEVSSSPVVQVNSFSRSQVDIFHSSLVSSRDQMLSIMTSQVGPVRSSEEIQSQSVKEITSKVEKTVSIPPEVVNTIFNPNSTRKVDSTPSPVSLPIIIGVTVSVVVVVAIAATISIIIVSLPIHVPCIATYIKLLQLVKPLQLLAYIVYFNCLQILVRKFGLMKNATNIPLSGTAEAGTVFHNPSFPK